MKRQLTIICVALFMAAIVAFGQNRALFVYDRNGGVTPVMFTEVDSIRFSCLGIDSATYTAPVTQEIWTPDTVYRLPLGEIDSVSFRTPMTVLKSHTIDLVREPIRPYVKGVSMETMTVVLNAGTPSAIVPKEGDCLVAMECGGVFDNGFIGRATAVRHLSTGIEIVCEPEDLTNAFERYYGIFQSVGYDRSDRNMTPEVALRKVRRHDNSVIGQPEYDKSFHKTFEIKPFVLSANLGADWAWNPDTDSIFQDMQSRDCLNTGNVSLTERDISFKITPVINIDYTVIIRKGEFLQRLSFSEKDNIEYDQRISHMIGKELVLSKSLNDFNPEIPLFYFTDLEFSATLGGDATVGLRHWNETEYYHSFSFERKSQVELGKVTVSSGSRVIDNYWDLNVGGRIGADVHVTPMIKLLHKDLLSLRADFYAGVELTADFLYRLMEYKSRATSPALYKALKGKSLSFGPVVGMDVTANLGPLQTKLYSKALQLDPWWESLSIPSIRNLSVSTANGKSAVSMTVFGHCLTDHKIGFQVIRNSDGVVTEWIDEERPFDRAGDSMDYSHEFDFEITENDEVYPLVEYYDTMIRAVPSWPVTKAPVFFPFTSYQSENGIRVMSGATAVGSEKDDETTYHIGNLLPFHPFVKH